MARKSFGPRKQRTRQHVIADQSINHVDRFIIDEGGSSDGSAVMKRTDVTYGQLDKVLRGLGFSCRVVTEEPATRVYEHKESGAWLMFPRFPEEDLVLDYHLASARTTLDGFGIADAKVFAAKLQKAG